VQGRNSFVISFFQECLLFCTKNYLKHSLGSLKDISVSVRKK
jgi:hypothetical protein